MAIQIKPKPVSKPVVYAPISAELTVEASPYIGTELWADGVEYFHSWLCEKYTVGKPVADYIVSRDMDVHRVISDYWLSAVIQAGLAKNHVFCIGRISTDNESYNEAPGFVLLPPRKRLSVDIIIPEELVEYDPWESREHDADAPDALFPDMYIDKHYDVLLNEMYIVEKRPRLRRRRMIYPVDFARHPRHADKNNSPPQGSPPPIEWRDILERLSTDDT